MGNYTNPLVHSGKIKDILTASFLDDELIRNLVMPQTDDSISLEANWNRHCLNTQFHPSAASASQAILCLETQIAYARSSSIQFQLIISAYASQDMVSMTEETGQFYKNQYGLTGNRIDMITAAVHRHLTEDPDYSRSFGIGQIQLSEDKDSVTSQWRDNYYGKSMVYNIYCLHKPSVKEGR